MSKDYLRTIARLCDVYLDNACLTKQCLPYTTFLQSPLPPYLLCCTLGYEVEYATDKCMRKLRHAYAVSLDRMHFDRDFEHTYYQRVTLLATFNYKEMNVTSP